MIGKRIDVLDKGWIELVDLMPHPDCSVPGDLAIVNAARVSFLGESKGEERDKKLLFYLMKHRHTSPFEMVEFKFRVKAPLVTWWQWARHRTWSFNAQCLDGETLITFNRPDKLLKGINVNSGNHKLSDLYKKWNENNHKQNRIKNMFIRTVNEETMLLDSAHIGDIVFAGNKDAFKVVLSDGKELICSKDHKFLFSSGWNTLENGVSLYFDKGTISYSKELPSLYVNGNPLETSYLYTNKEWLYYQYHTRCLPIKEIAKLANCSYHTIRKYLKTHNLTDKERGRFSKGDVPWNTGKNYSFNFSPEQRRDWSEKSKKHTKRGKDSNFWKGGISSLREMSGAWATRMSKFVFERDKYTCALCNKPSDDNCKLHIHHIVPFWANEELAFCEENLITLHKDCHIHLHKNSLELDFAQKVKSDRNLPFDVDFNIDSKFTKQKENMPANSHATPHLVKIDKIEYVGKRDMYDIVVDGEYPNFIANGIVVHNSGRYTPFEENDFYHPWIWRKQSKDNKQASEGLVSADEGKELNISLSKHYDESFRLYSETLEKGVSKEMARLFLPGFSVYYTWVVKVDAHNLMNFLRLRMAKDAQYEIRVYAEAIYEFFCDALPWTSEAFSKYIIGSADDNTER